MVFNDENIKYCLLSWDFYEEAEDNAYGNQKIPISGLFNWANALNGARTFPRSEQDLAQFNLYHINITSRNLFLLETFLKQKPREAKLLLNVDYAVEMWSQSFPVYPDLFFSLIDKADYIFAVEPLQSEILSTELRRNVPVIPHPVATHLLKNMRSPERDNQIGISLHRYDTSNLYPAALVARRLPKHFQTVAVGSTSSKATLLHLFDFIKETTPFEEFIKTINRFYAVFESYSMHSYGRFTAECAALGIPCVGATCVHSLNECFPDLTYFDTNSIERPAEHLNDLINDQAFYSEMVNKSIELSENFSYKTCKEKLFKLLNG